MKTPRTVYDTLLAAYHLLDNKSHWTREALARDISGFSVPPESPKAVRWCALGALKRVGWNRVGAQVFLKAACSPHTISKVNDCQGYDAIRRAYRKAIKACRP